MQNPSMPICESFLKIAVLCLCVTAIQGSPPRADVPSPTEVKQTQAGSQSPNEEVQALRAQLEVMRRYDDRILSTVYWSLGTVVLLAVLLYGFSWYTNF